jgi:sec-independent protein translocase protein TatC
MSKNPEKEMSFLEHLEVMRWHLLRSIAAIIILALVAFVFKDIVFDKIILAPKEPPFPTNRWLCRLGEILNLQRICINQDPFPLQTVKMAEQFSMHIMVSLVAGIVVAFPYIFWEFWRFIVPALYENEKKTASGAVFYTSMLFILGVAFGYYIIAPLSVNFLGNYQVSESVISAPTLRSYVGTITSVVLAAGVVFQLPILVYFLSKVGLVTPDFLKRYRRHSLVLIVTLSAIITPPDVFSQILVAFPLVILYEIGIAISKRIVRERDAEFSDDDPPKQKAKAKAEPEVPKTDPEGGAKSTESYQTQDGTEPAGSAESSSEAEPEAASDPEDRDEPESPSEARQKKTKGESKENSETREKQSSKPKTEKPPWKKPGDSEESSPAGGSD